MVINTGLLAANTAMNKETIPNTKVIKETVLLEPTPLSNPTIATMINMNAMI